MKATIVTIHEAKMNLSQLLRRASNEEEIIISRRSTPVAGLFRSVRQEVNGNQAH